MGGEERGLNPHNHRDPFPPPGTHSCWKSTQRERPTSVRSSWREWHTAVWAGWRSSCRGEDQWGEDGSMGAAGVPAEVRASGSVPAVHQGLVHTETVRMNGRETAA